MNTHNKRLEDIAENILKCAISHEPDSCLVGNVTAAEIALLASTVLHTCPECRWKAAHLEPGYCDVCGSEWDPHKGVL